jgi:hypothetical protein
MRKRKIKITGEWEHVIVRLIRRVPGWLGIFNMMYDEDATEDMWEFLMSEEGRLVEFKDIPERFRTPAVLAKWVKAGKSRTHQLTKEYVSPELIRRIKNDVASSLRNALSSEELKIINKMKAKGEGITLVSPY